MEYERSSSALCSNGVMVIKENVSEKSKSSILVITAFEAQQAQKQNGEHWSWSS